MASAVQTAARVRPRVLHVGCGADPLPIWLADHEEVRLDLSNEFGPDVVADMTAMGDAVPSGEFDVLYCSHSLEHVHKHQVGLALSEFRRVVRSGGFVIVVVPDLQDVQPTDEIMFISPSGPITGHDLYYGFSSEIADHPEMAHKTGFTSATLRKAIESAGLLHATVERLQCCNLFGVGVAP